MKKMLLCGVCVALLATVVGAKETRVTRASLSTTSIAPVLLGQNDGIVMPPSLSPVPDPNYSQMPTNQYPASPYPVESPVYGGSSQMGSGRPVEIYQNVRYRGLRNVSPCAVPTIIQIPDPCNKDACCKTCVNVEVCVPPCDPKRIRITRDGDKVRYDYGKYAVVVRSAANQVVVHYQD